MTLPFKVKICYVNFLLLTIVGVLTYFSGFVLWFILPRGGPRWLGVTESSFMGLSRDVWIDVHILSSLVLLALVILHVALNWNWIKSVTRCLITGSGRH